MNNKETFLEALNNPNSNFRKEMIKWWSEIITKNDKKTNNKI